ncbi:MAG TPA: response regulator transcription factor, partial [Acidobacteriota bacterium]|nr:response regulator transcription factor [Acidobacteriota bacterium]
MKHRIFIVDDHPIVRLGMAELINQQEDLEVCGNCEGGEVALQSIPQADPSLLVIDISLNGMDGIELVKIVKRT